METLQAEIFALKETPGAAAFPATQHSGCPPDEVEALKAELTSLKEELTVAKKQKEQLQEEVQNAVAMTAEVSEAHAKRGDEVKGMERELKVLASVF